MNPLWHLLDSFLEWFIKLSSADEFAFITCLATCGLVITGIIGFIFVWRQIKEAKNAFGQSQKELATKDFLRQLYDQRLITIYDGKNQTQPLRYARASALTEYKENQGEWRKAVCMKPEKIKGDGKEIETYTRQNRIAYATAEITQDLGLACFSGTIPINYILASNADAVLDDWLICASWVKNYREKQQVRGRMYGKQKIPFHRRHGEWIASVCYLYMKGTWTYEKQCNLFLKEFQYVNGKDATPEEFVKQLCDFEPDLLDADAKRVVDTVRNKVFCLSHPWFFQRWWFTICKKLKHIASWVRRPRPRHS